MTPPFLDAGTVARLLPLADAVEVVERGFASSPAGEEPRRTVLEVPGGQLLLMPGHRPTAVGVKVVAVAPGNPALGAPRIQGLYLLMDVETLAPRLLVDGGALTALRTPATSAVATRRLAVAGARSLVVFGAGPQAEGHVHAMRAVRPLEDVRVVSRTAARAHDLVDRLRRGGVGASVGTPEDVRAADVVCTCTTSAVPVLEGRLLAAHAHVNAVGSHEPRVREVDSEVVRTSQVAVESRQAASQEAGDLLVPLRAGEVDERLVDWELAELVRGEGPAPVPERRSLFKSVGVALEDLVVAEELARRWEST